MGHGGKPFTAANGWQAVSGMMVGGFLRVAWPILALALVALPAQADPCVGSTCVGAPPNGACLLTHCIAVASPEPGCKPVQFTGRGPLDVAIDLSCLTAFPLMAMPRLP
jgi:hypothetical protein